MKGKGTPVKGTDDVITPKFIKAWKVIQIVMPAASSRLKESGALVAIRIPR